MMKREYGCCGVICLPERAGKGESRMIEANANRLWYKQPAANWNETLPVGNGRIGAVFYGGAASEKISLNEDTLWSGCPKAYDGPPKVEVYHRIRQKVLEGKNDEAQAIFENEFSEYLVQMYLPLADICIETQTGGPVTGYARQLDLANALHTVTYQSGGVQYQRESFVSFPHQVLAVRLTADRAGALSFTAVLQGSLKHTAFCDGGIFIEGNCPVCRTPYGMVPKEEHKFYAEDDAQKGVAYRAGICVVTDGTVTYSGNTAAVSGASSATLLFAVRTSFNGPFRHPVLDGRPYKNECAEDLQKAAALGYDALKAQHIADYTALYSRVELALGESENSALPTDERLYRHADGAADPALYTLLFNFGRYLTISASREGTTATNLQGIWNAKHMPPWSSNYTVNINTQMNYWPTLVCSLPECYRPLVEFVKNLDISGRKTAKNFYGARGFVTHHNSDIWCTTHPSGNHLPGSTQWGFWCMGSGWFTMMLYEYYRYTGDKSYLREIFPVLQDAAEFYADLLIEDTDGSLILCPSTSPENNYLAGTQKGYTPIDKTTTMTMSIVRDVFSCYVQAADVLQENAEEIAALLPKLRGFSIMADGRLNEWYGEHKDWEPDHRHMSHMYALFPSRQITADDPALADACRKVLEGRGDGGTGWSLAWKISLWAHLRDGNHALRLLDNQLKPVDSAIDEPVLAGGSYINLFCAHPPFQIDGNFGATCGVAQMLLQEKDGEPILLPALPDTWQKGRAKGFALPGGRHIDFAWENGKVTEQKVY